MSFLSISIYHFNRTLTDQSLKLKLSDFQGQGMFFSGGTLLLLIRGNPIQSQPIHLQSLFVFICSLLLNLCSLGFCLCSLLFTFVGSCSLIIMCIGASTPFPLPHQKHYPLFFAKPPPP